MFVTTHQNTVAASRGLENYHKQIFHVSQNIFITAGTEVGSRGGLQVWFFQSVDCGILSAPEADQGRPLPKRK